MTPDNGGRIELRLQRTEAGLAHYLAELRTPEQTFVSLARIEVVGGSEHITFDPWQSDAGAQPPSWLADGARAVLKLAVRGAGASGAWPRRISRWRPAPEAEASR